MKQGGGTLERLVLDALEEVEEVIRALALDGLAVVYRADGALLLIRENANLLLLGLIAEALELSVILAELAILARLDDDISPTLLHDGEAEVLLLEPDLTVRAIASLVLDAVDNGLANEEVAEELAALPGPTLSIKSHYKRKSKR